MIGNFSSAPFGREVIDRRALTGRHDLGTGGLGLAGNIVWFVFARFWLALSTSPGMRRMFHAPHLLD
jgi:uncharacterized membrane protein YccF (DUF307 family)